MWTGEICNSSGADSSDVDNIPEKVGRSPDMFADCPTEEEINDSDVHFASSSENINPEMEAVFDPASCTVIPLAEFQNYQPLEFPPVMPSRNHTVMFDIPVVTEIPKPHRGKDKWDRDHVKMPYSSQSLYPVNENGSNTMQSRWNLIQAALLRPIASSQELEDAILVYNAKYKEKWTFRQLHRLFKVLEPEETEYFFDKTLPSIIQLALQLPDLVPKAIPLLRQNKSQSLSLSQQQIACLLANAFLCTFPHRNTQRKQCEYVDFPDINFNKFYQSGQNENHIIEKLKCICHYFRRVCNKAPLGVVTFSRKHMPTSALPRWNCCEDDLGQMKLHVCSDSTIEEGGSGMLQVDFANKFIGGGVLGWGCVQEEIRFIICPELIISRLFTEVMKPNEAIIINGVEQYSKYSGYGHTFVWAGDFKDDTSKDSSCRLKCALLAIDALHFVQPQHQFMRELMRRELNKAYVGFNSSTQCRLLPLATGNWGCGAYRGDPSLKFLLQFMASTYAQRDMVYFTFDDSKLRSKIYSMYNFLKENHVTIGQLWTYLCDFQKSNLPGYKLYAFIMQSHTESTLAKSQKICSTPLQNKDYTLKFQKTLLCHSASALPSTSVQKPLWHTFQNNKILSDVHIEVLEHDSSILENHSRTYENTESEFKHKSKINVKSLLVDKLTALDNKNCAVIAESPSKDLVKGERQTVNVEKTVTVTFVNETTSPLKLSDKMERSTDKDNTKAIDLLKNSKSDRSQQKKTDFYSLFYKK